MAAAVRVAGGYNGHMGGERRAVQHAVASDLLDETEAVARVDFVQENEEQAVVEPWAERRTLGQSTFEPARHVGLVHASVHIERAHGRLH